MLGELDSATQVSFANSVRFLGDDIDTATDLFFTVTDVTLNETPAAVPTPAAFGAAALLVPLVMRRKR